MKERPILFSAPMVRAILDGKKTQTRRVVKPQPTFDEHRREWSWENKRGRIAWTGEKPLAAARLGALDLCPHGGVGDRLWVRETWYCDHAFAGDYEAMHDMGVQYPPEKCHAEWAEEMYFRADVPSGRFADAGYWGESGCWRPSIFMPRWASRITLEITDVRVERLQDISEEDAKAEGVVPFVRDEEGDCWTDGKYRTAFNYLWESINGKRAPWSSNPWVWVISFRRVE